MNSVPAREDLRWRAEREEEASIPPPHVRMLSIVSRIPGLLHEHRKPFLRSDLVQNVVEQAGEDPVSAVAVRNPQPTFSEPETSGKLDDFGVRRNDLIECRISPGDGERLGFEEHAAFVQRRNRGRAAIQKEI